MILEGIEFLREQFISVCRGERVINNFRFFPQDTVEHQGTAENTVPSIVVEDFLMGGKAFGRLKLRLRRLAQQDNMQIIHDEVLRNLPLEPSRLCSALFHVHWEIFDRLINKVDGSTDMSQVLALTGGTSQAYGSGCTDYLNQVWSDSKYDICSHIHDYLKQSPQTYGKSLGIEIVCY